MVFKVTRAIFHTGKTPWLFYGFFVGLPILLVLLKPVPSVSTFYPIVFIASLVYCFALLPASQYFTVKRALAQNPSARQLQRYEISENGIKNHSEGVDMSFSWDKTFGIKTTREFLFVYLTKKLAYYIPVELFSDSEIKQIYSWRNSSI